MFSCLSNLFLGNYFCQWIQFGTVLATGWSTNNFILAQRIAQSRRELDNIDWIATCGSGQNLEIHRWTESWRGLRLETKENVTNIYLMIKNKIIKARKKRKCFPMRWVSAKSKLLWSDCYLTNNKTAVSLENAFQLCFLRVHWLDQILRNICRATSKTS